MANTSSRTLRLLSLLQTHRHWSGDDLAGRLHVSIRTLRRDVERLRELGYPVQAARGVDGGYQLAPGASLPPLVLDDDEAVALAVGLQNAAQGGETEIAEASVRALTKVAQVMPPRLRRQVEAVRSATDVPQWGDAGPTLDSAILVTVAQSCRDSERLQFAYTAAGGEATQREVEPLRLVTVGRRWYLVAYDLDRADWRSFRLDRMAAPGTTGARFRPRKLPAADAASFVTDRLGGRRERHQVRVVVHADPAAVRRRVGGWSTVEPHPDGCLMSMQADSLDWSVLALGGLAADFTVLEPPALSEMLREWADRFARCTE